MGQIARSIERISSTMYICICTCYYNKPLEFNSFSCRKPSPM